MNSNKDTQLIWEAYLNDRQYPNRHKYRAIISELVDSFGHRLTISLLNRAGADMLMVEAADYTKTEPGDTKTRNSRSSLIDTLVYLHSQMETETDPGKKAELQNRFEMIMRHGKRHGITQYDIDRAAGGDAGGGPSSDEPGSTAGGSKSYTGYEHGTYDSDNPYSKEAAERNRKDMDDWFDNYNQQTAKAAADKYGIPVAVWQTYDDIIRGYVGLKVPKTKSTSRGGFFDQMDSMGQEIDQMAFDKWVDIYKKSAEDWIKRDSPNIPIAVERHIMTGEELLQVWDWYVNNYKDTYGNGFNGHDETHIQELPLAGVRTDEWRNKQHTSPPPGAAPEEEPEPDRTENSDPETQPEDDRQPSDDETGLLNDIHRLLKRGKAASGRIRNYLPLAGVYDPSGNQRDLQIADDTETLLDLIDLLRQLNKTLKQT